MANESKEAKGDRLEFTVSMDADRVLQIEEIAAARGLNRTALIRTVMYGWLDEQPKPAGGGPANGAAR